MATTPFTVYAPQTSPRLLYVLDWLFAQQLKTGYILTHNLTDVEHLPFYISYGNTGALSIPDAGLLWQQGVTKQDIVFGEWNNIPTLFSAKDNDCSLPFDLFSAIFFLLSRYEEYYPYTPDKHGRYPATQSVLYQQGWLQRPLVDEWLHALRLLLVNHFGIPITEPSFSFQSTYDIDIAYSYLHKGWKRNAGGLLKDVLTGKLSQVAERLSVLNNPATDPYDCFTWLQELHKKQNHKPIYFVLAALHTTAYDKNISPLHPAMQQLISGFAAEGMVGMHPSYYSNTNTQTFQEEKNTLEKICGKDIRISRQHYIRYVFPDTPRLLMQHDITDDYSMGYGTHLGFRAGTGLSFFWYDIPNETTTPLNIHPFCFMDSTAFYEERLSADKAFELLCSMKEKLQTTGSQLIIVFHNFSLGNSKEWAGWREWYEFVLK
jgi:hypothetical protein